MEKKENIHIFFDPSGPPPYSNIGYVDWLYVICGKAPKYLSIFQQGPLFLLLESQAA